MIVVDSSVWIAQIRGHGTDAVKLLERIERPSRIVVGDLVLFEVLQGTRDDAHSASLESRLRRFRVEAMFDEKIAIAAARHNRLLRASGITVRKPIDLLIATFCMERGYALIHQDRDFDMIARHLDLRIL